MLNYVVLCLNYVADRQMKYFEKRGVPGRPQGAVENMGQQGGWSESMGATRGSESKDMDVDGGSPVGHLGSGAQTFQQPFFERQRQFPAIAETEYPQHPERSLEASTRVCLPELERSCPRLYAGFCPLRKYGSYLLGGAWEYAGNRWDF